MNQTKPNALGAEFEKIISRVPFATQLDDDDMGFLILMAVCKLNGSRLEDNNIYHGNELIGNKLNYRFDGHVLEFAYYSKLKEKIVTSTIRIK